MERLDLRSFSVSLEDRLFELQDQLRTSTYIHESYEHFYVCDPKRRYISKASVRDRVVHQAVVQVVEPIFEKQFIFDSYASRIGKGTHASVARLERFLRKASGNYRRVVYVLKCDIRKFFDSVRHDILLQMIAHNVCDERLMWLIDTIVKSYAVDIGRTRGLPLGNVTSQLFTNIYLNSLDYFVKEQLRMRWYVRFCDDFVIVHRDKKLLEQIIPQLENFLVTRCALTLHPNKVSIRKLSHGVDFVGQVLRPYYRVLRTKTRRRIFRDMIDLSEAYRKSEITQERFRASIRSYFGILNHGSNYQTQRRLREKIYQVLFRTTMD